MMNKQQKYLALDLELNNAQDGSTPNPSIIQVGISIGSLEQNQNEWLTKKWYVKVNEPIYPFITGLTGITNDDIKQFGVSHYDIGRELSNLIKEHECFTNPVTWGGGDSTELKEEFKKYGVEFPHFGRRWIDVKTWYVLHMLSKGKKPAGGLSSAMNEMGLKFDGVPHRADVDAKNTLALFFQFILRQHQMATIINSAKELR